MGIRGNQYIDVLFKRIDQIPISTSGDLARVLPLYIKAANDNGVVKNMSFAYIDNYDGHAFYKKFSKQFDFLQSMFSKNSLFGKDIRDIFKRVAIRKNRIPKTMKDMDRLKGIVLEEMQAWLRIRRLAYRREKLVSRFKVAVKHYLNMTYQLGFNEPSNCVKYLVESHQIDKYIMSGDFAVLLLPFMPEVEEAIRKNYEHYEMKDAWENLKGRYFNHKAEYANLATEIKSTFNRTIRNFSQYFDNLYTDTYYKMMLSRRRQDG